MEIFGNAIMPVVIMILLIGAIMIISKKSSTRKDAHYDEMQLKNRATGYKIGFFVMLIGLYAFGFLIEFVPDFGKVVSPSFCMMAVGFVGIVTFAVYCIFKDAFYSVGQNRKGYIIICFLVILANGLGSTGHISDGTISFSNYGNYLCAAAFLVILISLIVKEAMSRKEVDE